MEIFKHIIPLQDNLRKKTDAGISVGFVPTMGALHKGHISLVECSVKQNALTIVSIFVNPTQFNDKNDLINYPRSLKADFEKLRQTGCDMVFVPDEEEIYPEVETRTFDFGGLDSVMEGKFRPGHFNGVAQVVLRLFEIVKPRRAYFGYKDFQQLVIIRHIVDKYDIPVDIISCPIVREASGLAMSSRNERLTGKEKETASKISQVLFFVRDNYQKFASVADIRKYIYHQLSEIYKLRVEYFEIVDEVTLQPVTNIKSVSHVTACIAVWVGQVRLIDNVIIYS